MRETLNAYLERPLARNLIIAVILVNAVTLGLETIPPVMERFGPLLTIIDQACLTIFVVELVLKMVGQGAEPLHHRGDRFQAERDRVHKDDR
ncbi:MAG: ion transporter, partial [Pseudomonadota bacterium]